MHVTPIKEMLCECATTLVFITATYLNHQSQQVKALGAKPDALSPVLGIHVAGKNPLLQVVFWSPHEYHHTHMHTCTCTRMH